MSAEAPPARAANAAHLAFRKGAEAEAEQLAVIAAAPELLSQEDDSWEGWIPIHNAARWGVSERAVEAAVCAYPVGAKTPSRGGYEPLHLCAMGGHIGPVRAIVAAYPEGAFKKDNNGRTPLDEAREGGHDEIVKLLLSLPGVAEADAAEQALRAARTAELLRDDDGEEEVGATTAPTTRTTRPQAAQPDAAPPTPHTP